MLWPAELTFRIVTVVARTSVRGDKVNWYRDVGLGWMNSLEACLQVLATGLQLAGIVQGAVCGRSEGAILGALRELELTVLGNVAAIVGDLRRGTLVAGNALTLQGREDGARWAAIHVGYQILVALVVDLAVVVVGETSFLSTNRWIIRSHTLHTATAARVEFLERIRHISDLFPARQLASNLPPGWDTC